MLSITPDKILIETQRLIIGHISEEYFTIIAKQQKDPDLMKFFGGPRTDEKIQWSLDLMWNHYKKHGFSQGPVFEKKSGQIIGRAGLVKLDFEDDSPYVETCVFLMPQFWRQGFSVELRYGLIQYAFKALGVGRVYSTMDPRNTWACKGAENLGMILEREGYYKTLDKVVRYYYIDKLNKV